LDIFLKSTLALAIGRGLSTRRAVHLSTYGLEDSAPEWAIDAQGTPS